MTTAAVDETGEIIGMGHGHPGEDPHRVHHHALLRPRLCGRPGMVWGNDFRTNTGENHHHPQFTGPMDFYYLDSTRLGEATAP